MLTKNTAQMLGYWFLSMLVIVVIFIGIGMLGERGKNHTEIIFHPPASAGK